MSYPARAEGLVNSTSKLFSNSLDLNNRISCHIYFKTFKQCVKVYPLSWWALEYACCNLCGGVRPPPNMIVLGTTINCIWWWGCTIPSLPLLPGLLTWSGSTCKDLIYGSSRWKVICIQPEYLIPYNCK